MKRTIWLDRRAPHVWLMAFAAAFTLLHPALGAISPSLAGWNPTHSHVYTTTAAVSGAHHHPYDTYAHDAHQSATTGQNGEDEGVAFTSSSSVSGAVLAALSVATIRQPGIFARDRLVTHPALSGLVLTPRPRPPQA